MSQQDFFQIKVISKRLGNKRARRLWRGANTLDEAIHAIENWAMKLDLFESDCGFEIYRKNGTRWTLEKSYSRGEE